MSDVVLNAWPQVPIRWFDLVDIAIVAFLIYEFLKLIRRTRAAQMVAGVVLVFGLYYASERAPLSTVNCPRKRSLSVEMTASSDATSAVRGAISP